MFEMPLQDDEMSQIVKLLSSLELFKDLPPLSLEALAKEMKMVIIRGGKRLIHQGERDDSLYILLSGRLRVYQNQKDGEEEAIAEITQHEFVGEMALLTKEPRTATVRAIRDSKLLKLERSALEKFEKNHPKEVLQIAKISLKRLIHPTVPTFGAENIRTIAIAPASNSNHLPFLQQFVSHLSKKRPTIVVNQELCNRHFGKEMAQLKFGEAGSDAVTEWLTSLEESFGFVIYETDFEMTPWTERCLRSSDRVILALESKAEYELNTIEEVLFAGHIEILPVIDLVFIHHHAHIEAEGSHLWLERRPTDNYFHLNITSVKDFARLIRFLTGEAFGVVLNGGGARGFVHAGIMRALDDLGVPVDFVGGTSMGAILAAGYSKYGALGTINLCTEVKEVRAFGKDYTLPMLSLCKGKKIYDLYKILYGDSFIEDLWIRFFCVSTNLTQVKPHVHTQGPLWLAIRASTAIPAMYPPVYDDEGNMYVDGGVMDNMPVATMRKLLGGGKILAINCNKSKMMQPKPGIKELWISGWKLFFQKIFPFKSAERKRDDILSILGTALNAGAITNEEKMRDMADYYLELETRQYSLLQCPDIQEVIDYGYTIGMEELPKILGLQKSTLGAKEDPTLL